MSVQTLYVAHTAGTVLGSRTRSPWVAASAAHAAAAAWDGQPVFTDRAEAFDWIEAVRGDGVRWLDFAVARVDADTYLDPPGPRRVRIDDHAVDDPHRQVVRADSESPGPHVGVLTALYRGVHEQALPERWRATTPANRASALTDAVWHATYPIGFHDAAQVLAGRVGHAAHLLLTDPDPRQDLDEPTAAGLAALTRAATSIAHIHLEVPGPPRVLAAVTAAGLDTDPDRGWSNAVDRVWGAALRTAADDATSYAATTLRLAWRGQPDTLTRQAFGVWLERALTSTRQAVTAEWGQACEQRPPQPGPAAARAYRSVTRIAPLNIRPATPVAAAPPVPALASARVR
jgi:hypothetical protein